MMLFNVLLYINIANITDDNQHRRSNNIATVSFPANTNTSVLRNKLEVHRNRSNKREFIVIAIRYEFVRLVFSNYHSISD